MKRTEEGSKAARRRLLSLGLAFLLWSGTAWATVKLNLWTAPDGGVAGTSFVNLTGSGFPTANGTISPADVSISLSLACGGPVVAATAASGVKHVIGSSYRIQFELPASLLSGNYFASISGMTADRTPFSSGNCSEVAVTASTASNVLISRTWTLPFESESFKCRAIQLQSDMYIIGFHPISTVDDFHMVLTVSDTPFPAGDYDCSPGSGLDRKGFYAAGLGTNDLTFPPGVAVHLKAGQFINMNVHVVNLTATDVTGLAGVEVQTTSAASVTDEVEMIFGGTFNIGGVSGIPSDGMTHTASGGCNAPQDYHVVALWPHMHSVGTRIKLEQTHAGVPQTLLDIPYTDTSQLVYPLSPPALVQQGDQVQVTCSFVNNTGHPVHFGDSVTEENCFMGIYRYPVINPGYGLFECTSG